MMVGYKQSRPQANGTKCQMCLSTTLRREIPPLHVQYQDKVSGIDTIDKGSAYAAERPINVVIDPRLAYSSTSGIKPRSAFAVSYPKGKSTSYESFIDPHSASFISASISNVDTSQWIVFGPVRVS